MARLHYLILIMMVIVLCMADKSKIKKKKYYPLPGETCKEDYFETTEPVPLKEAKRVCKPCADGYENKHASANCHPIKKTPSTRPFTPDDNMNTTTSGKEQIGIGEPAITEEIVPSSTFIEDVTEVITNIFTQTKPIPTEIDTGVTTDSMFSYTPVTGNSASNVWIPYVAVTAAILGFICIAVLIFVIVKRRWKSANKPENPQRESIPLTQLERQHEDQDA